MKRPKNKNIGASVRARLLNYAKQLGIDFNRMLLIYIQERFLYRLSRSSYRSRFILKGGILFYAAHKEKARSTKDIDLLAKNIPNERHRIISYFNDILSIHHEDGVIFLADTMSVVSIENAAEYKGMRIKFNGKLDTAIINLQVDIGFNDEVVPKPITFDYPELLSNETIKLKAYSWESVIAEKFEVILKLGSANSRMKDFFDINFLQQNTNFDAKKLQAAIFKTLQSRNTDILYYKDIFSDSFKKDLNKQNQWNSFLKKIGHKRVISFNDLLNEIEIFLFPIIKAIIEKQLFERKWNCNTQTWIFK